MKFNTIPKILLSVLSASLIVISACKSYLEVEPQGQLTEINYFKTPGDALLGTNAIYNTLRIAFYNEGIYPILDIMSDDTRKGSNPGDGLSNVQPYDNFSFSATTQAHANWYTTLYQGVRRATAVIENVPSISMDNTLKNRYIAEARFLRALFYLDLVRAFGPVPKITLLNPPNKVSRDTSIYRTLILPDLDFAIANLPSVYPKVDAGRATKGAAYALKARAALFFRDFPLAASSAKEVINSQVYGLESDFSDAFNVLGNYGKESVFEVGAVAIDDFGTGGNQYGEAQGVRGNPNRGWGFNRPSLSLIAAFEPGDPRKDKSIIFLNEVLDGVTIFGDPSTPDSTRDRATNDLIEIECYNQKIWGTGTAVLPSWGIHRKIIRFADVLLIAAEALNENGESGEALSYLNLIRARARAGDQTILPDFQNTDQAELRNAIYRERRVELALESQRFFDLIRTGRAVSELGPLGFKANRNERFPIPQIEIDITEGSLSQNPGW